MSPALGLCGPGERPLSPFRGWHQLPAQAAAPGFLPSGRAKEAAVLVRAGCRIPQDRQSARRCLEQAALCGSRGALQAKCACVQQRQSFTFSLKDCCLHLNIGAHILQIYDL